MSDGIEIRRIDALACRIAPRAWAFEMREAKRIAAHWRVVSAEKPHVFNGRVLLASEWSLTGGVFAATFFETSYAAMLAWLSFGEPADETWNIFAMAALRSADGAFILGEMSARTAQPGRIYFPAGTPDRDDVNGEGVDLGGSVIRELEEETGLTSAEVEPAPDWTLIATGKKVALMRDLRSALPATALKARIDGFLAADPASELERMHIVATSGDIDPVAMPAVQCAYLRHRLG